MKIDTSQCRISPNGKRQCKAKCSGSLTRDPKTCKLKGTVVHVCLYWSNLLSLVLQLQMRCCYLFIRREHLEKKKHARKQTNNKRTEGDKWSVSIFNKKNKPNPCIVSEKDGFGFVLKYRSPQGQNNKTRLLCFILRVNIKTFPKKIYIHMRMVYFLHCLHTIEMFLFSDVELSAAETR